MAPYDERDRVLLKYWEQAGGILYEQVRVGKQGLDSAYRRIDAVRIQGEETKREWFDRHAEEFAELLAGAEVEVIEAKRKLNGEAIGQAIVAKHLLEIEYETTLATPVICCEEGDAVLERICRALGIRIWTTKKGFLVPLRPAAIAFKV
jgi:hypothetical protein